MKKPPTYLYVIPWMLCNIALLFLFTPLQAIFIMLTAYFAAQSIIAATVVWVVERLEKDL